MTADRIARLKITLDDVKPQVLRRIEVPLTIRLDRLHEVLQAALGWTNSHLYELRAQDVGWGIPDPGFGNGPLDARKARLIDVLEDLGTSAGAPGRRCRYCAASTMRRWPPEALHRQREGYREGFACAARWRQPPGRASATLDSTGAGAGTPAARCNAADALTASANR